MRNNVAHTLERDRFGVCYFLRSNIARRDVVREREKTSRRRSYLPLVLPISILSRIE